ncbi:extradiol ring-cleavage dioxygenase, partial [Rhodococcus sp. NPDC127530]
MGDFLALGMTHYPLLAGTDEHMAGLLRWTLTDPDIPVEEKDPRMSRAPWNFGGGPVSFRLRSPDHCARRVRQI